jgi:hypothetical protein
MYMYKKRDDLGMAFRHPSYNAWLIGPPIAVGQR